MKRNREGWPGTRHVDREIDEWIFRARFIHNGQRPEYATFVVKIDRAASVQQKEDEREAPEIKFRAKIDVERSTEAFKKAGEIKISSNDIGDLRAKVQKAFEAVLATDWRKVIIVGIDIPKNYHRTDSTSAGLNFNFLVCEKSGDIYRDSTGFQTCTRDVLIDGDERFEFEYDAAIEAALNSINGRIGELGEALKKIIASRSKLLKIKLAPLALEQ